MVPAKNRQSIRCMIARQGGEVWIQPATRDERHDGTVEFESFGMGGQHQGTIRLTGLPAAPGELLIRGRKLLWIASEGANSGGSGVPYLGVYDLIEDE
jgi:hypothetical protein